MSIDADIVYHQDELSRYQQLQQTVDDSPDWKRAALLDEYEININFHQSELDLLQAQAAAEEEQPTEEEEAEDSATSSQFDEDEGANS